MSLDLWDGFAVVGLALVGGAVWLVGDWPGLLTYLGLVCIVAGVMGARARAGRV